MERLNPTAPFCRTVLKLLCFVQLLVVSSVTAQTGTRIIGGYPCEKRQPWQAALYDDDNDLYCGGALISKDWVLTAAHCMDNGFRKVHLGEFNLSQPGKSVQQRTPSKIIPHQNFSSLTYDNDIMLIKLNRPIVISRNVRPIKLAKRTTSPGTKCLASGWGDTSITESPTPDLLQCVKLRIISASQCRKTYHKYLTENMLCAAAAKDGTGTYKGDSGGPLVCDEWLQGIVSFGLKRPGVEVFAKVSKYINWIKETIQRG